MADFPIYNFSDTYIDACGILNVNKIFGSFFQKKKNEKNEERKLNLNDESFNVSTQASGMKNG